MKQNKKYATSGLVEAQYEPGSRNRVLKNLPGIKKKIEMDSMEALALKQAEEEIINTYGANHRFNTSDICKIHKIWLGNIYPWAGKFRKVNLSKGEFNFAAAAQIPHLMDKFEDEYLFKFTPCNFINIDKVINAISIVHVELILIHPFREGNGRVARLLSTLMALQAGYPPLDFSFIKNEKKEEYFKAVNLGLDRNYLPMESIFREVFQQTVSNREGR